jgi:hypothetical protein
MFPLTLEKKDRLVGRGMWNLRERAKDQALNKFLVQTRQHNVAGREERYIDWDRKFNELPVLH